MLKILFVIHELSYGGAEKIMSVLLNNFAMSGYEVFLLTYEKDQIRRPLHEKINHISSSKYNLNIKIIKRIFQITYTRHIIRMIKPDVVISFLNYPNMISIISSFGMNVPVIISERGDPTVTTGWFYQLRDFIYSFADGIVFQTKYAKNYYGNRIKGKSIVITNPVIPYNRPIIDYSQRENIVVHIGRFDLKQKRQDILLKAFYKVSKIHPQYKLVLYGDGEDEVIIRKLIMDLNLEDRVILAGFSPDIYSSIENAKIFVLSSDFEGIPNALLEAMSAGLPCISTRYSPGGVEDIISNMENGIIVERGDEDSLAWAINYLISNPDIAMSMGKKAQQVVNTMGPEKYSNEWKNFINIVVKEKKH